ncbi:MAG: hypothetical protein ACR2HJ_13060 [Fimbriimonadales bacterium]
MKNIAIIAAFAALAIAGCGNKDEGAANTETPATTTPVAMSYDQGSKKVGDQGVCAVCMIKEGKTPAEEEVKAILDYGGKTYVFCDEAEKAEFISDPKKYVGK